jgi:iron complex transport system ATP-binding protein
MSALLNLEGASVSLGERRVLDGVDLTVSAGELVGVLGPNGAGKTTLLRAALGLAKLASGRALLCGHDVFGLGPEARARLVAYLPQERRLAWSLAAWRVASLGAVDRPPALARAAALQALARVEMSGLADRGVLEMSGGERARVLLARLLATRAPLLVADEPVAGLDAEAQFHTLDLLREETSAGRAVIVTLHDLALAARTCDRIVVVDKGRIVADGRVAETLTPARLAEVFGLAGALVETKAGVVLAARRADRPATEL